MRGRERATVPAVGKALEAGVVVLYVGLLTTTLFGGYVADYRASAGDELVDRTLATASHEVRDAVPPAATAARAHVRVDLPGTIRGESYRIEAEGESLVLDHPARGVGGRARLALPDRVDSLSGSWHSQQPAAVRVAGSDGDLAVRLVAGEAAERGLPEHGDGPGAPTDPAPCEDGPPCDGESVSSTDPCDGPGPCDGLDDPRVATVDDLPMMAADDPRMAADDPRGATTDDPRVATAGNAGAPTGGDRR